MEQVLIVAYEESVAGNTACLTVCRRAAGNGIFGVNSFWGTEAEQIYRKLTKQEGISNMAVVGTVTDNKRWLEDLPQRGHAVILHNQECPHGHKCQAPDCMECMKIYEKVDGLETGSADKVNTVPDGDMKMEEYI